EVLSNAGVLMEALLAARTWAVKEVGPNLRETEDDEFLMMGVPPYVANKVMEDVKKRYPDYGYREVAETINSQMGLQNNGVPLARALNQVNIEVAIPPQYRDDPVLFISQVLGLPILEPPTGARVVINERAGSIVISGDVEIGAGTLVGDGASIREQCRVGSQCIISRYVTVNYNTRVGNRTRIMDMTHLTGNSVIGDDVFISCMVATANDNTMVTRRYHEDTVIGPRIADKVSIGDKWIKHFEDEIRKIEPFVKDRVFRNEWAKIKRTNKNRLAAMIKERTGTAVDPDSLFDVQVKRIHEYKRQHLNVLHIITLYNRIKKAPRTKIVPRAFIFGGKAAPGYFMAKLIIKLINSVAEMVNNDPEVDGRLKVVFCPDFNVKNAHHIYPAADLSEQISTAGKEASGTGNMKFSMNGALTIGTLDGANVEIREEVGEENFFLFGLTVEDVLGLKAKGYAPRSYYESNPHLREAIDQIGSGHFSRGDKGLFAPLIDNLLNHDPFLLLADYQSYIDCQDRVSAAYRDQEQWVRMSILNTARMGKFSSDRSIREYCDNIWKVRPLKKS
ncbi:MAG: hypothetical protein HGA43_03330, partial [Nitrospirae bacterium]|nr:hypothetical protein [Nitrospirota bacterium]